MQGACWVVKPHGLHLALGSIDIGARPLASTCDVAMHFAYIQNLHALHPANTAFCWVFAGMSRLFGQSKQ